MTYLTSSSIRYREAKGEYANRLFSPTRYEQVVWIQSGHDLVVYNHKLVNELVVTRCELVVRSYKLVTDYIA